MKKVLFATTALVLTAGVASAEVTFSGKAEAGVIRAGSAAVTPTAKTAAAVATAQAAFDAAAAASDALPTTANVAAMIAAADALKAATAANTTTAATKADSFTVYSGFDLEMAASAATDMGATVSVSADIGGGSIADVADKELDAQGETIAAPAVKVEMNGVTLTIQNDGIDDYYDGDMSDYDIGVSGAMAGITYGVAFNTEEGVSSKYTLTGSYAAGPITASINMNDNGDDDQMAISVAYAMGDITATVTNDNKGAAESINSVGVAYASGGITASVSFKDDKGHSTNTNTDAKASWDVAVGYTAGAMTFNFSTNESEAWEADVAYDLGGATAFAATDSNETMMAGINFAF
jgi:outer membrane protein OmpU